ncbi:MAG: SAM-dependent chlorinase/fluorinase [Chloroflexi bacterium]|nr:SAM-dependent chlorinase/fluorinase [Chloroflexota bacterium]
MTTISLLTDFGIRDGNVGVMKGVIWGIAPHVKIADLSHQIAPQNIPEAAFTLLRSAFYFPPDSVHIVVVDPGVGTNRRPIAGLLGNQFFVGPDNGVFTLVLERAEESGWPVALVHTEKVEFWRSEVSKVFHGRDIFAPVGAHLAAGVALEKLGTPIDDMVRLQFPQPQMTQLGWQGEIIHSDHFGNLYANLRREMINGRKVINVSLGGESIDGLVDTFGEREPDELIALFSSTDFLMVSVVNGSAAERLGAKVGDDVEVELGDA